MAACRLTPMTDSDASLNRPSGDPDYARAPGRLRGPGGPARARSADEVEGRDKRPPDGRAKVESMAEVRPSRPADAPACGQHAGSVSRMWEAAPPQALHT